MCALGLNLTEIEASEGTVSVALDQRKKEQQKQWECLCLLLRRLKKRTYNI
jgi:hypothetical protein